MWYTKLWGCNEFPSNNQLFEAISAILNTISYDKFLMENILVYTKIYA